MLESWGLQMEPVVCEHCDWSYLLPENSLPMECPHCLQDSLTRVSDPPADVAGTSPELVVPFSVPADRLAQSVGSFASKIPFAPRDLTPSNLSSRLQKVFLPLWLVDAEVEANWQAEAGFNYDVVSHQDQYNDQGGGWSSRKLTETRVRWELRLGRLKRPYHNVPAPALEEHTQLRQKLGSYDFQMAGPYQSETVADAAIRLPSRLQEDAWTEAVPVFQSQAAQECQQAATADHIRQFRWQPEYSALNWTLLLVPVYATHYLDGDGVAQSVLVHGQSGMVSGPRRASMGRAKIVSLWLVGIAGLVFVLSLILALASLLLPPLLILAGLGLFIAFVMLLSAIVPLGVVWNFNRTQVEAANP